MLSDDARGDGMNRVAEVNKALRAQSISIKLRAAGRGYYYFDGEALAWRSSSVCVYRASDLTVDEWIREFSYLKSRA